MPLTPIRVAGKLQLVQMPADSGARDVFRIDEENTRRVAIARRRLYYEGRQYEADNLNLKDAKGLGPMDLLPEHDRKHAYSTQIHDAVDFVADQLAEKFSFEPTDPTVEVILADALRASDQFSGPNDDDEITVDDMLRDSLVAGDVAVELCWDPANETVYYECWESEQVEFRFITRRLLESVIRTEVVWVTDTSAADVTEKQVTERVVYEVVLNAVGVGECRKQTFWDEEDEPRESVMLGLPFIPWTLLRCDTKGIRSTRGESLISDQTMEHADRYNANEQTAWLIARYNSHGNLAVIGDGATLQARQEERIAKDVADVLTFPGGTNITAIQLPTDPQMIEHQRSVLSEAIYQSFGLTRIEPETFQLGALSGYALEILNRKADGTFRRIRKNFIQDLKWMFSMTLDITAYRTESTLIENPEPSDDPENPAPPIPVFWEVYPQIVFPSRAVLVRLGTGYIVDHVVVRDDKVAGLVSRADGLRSLGRSKEDIAQIEAEIAEEAAAALVLPSVGSNGAAGRRSGTTTNTTKAGATGDTLESDSVGPSDRTGDTAPWQTPQSR